MINDHVIIENHGSIVRMLPISEWAKDWFEDNVDNSLMMGKYYCAEPRFASDIILGFECSLSEEDLIHGGAA